MPAEARGDVDTPRVVRPLGFGELLDRAITIVVRHFGFWVVAFALHGVAKCTVVVENVNPFVAIGRAAARVVRAMLVALAGMLFGITHSAASVSLCSTIVGFFSSSLYSVLITCYYRDVRLRRDGADVLEGIAA